MEEASEILGAHLQLSTEEHLGWTRLCALVDQDCIGTNSAGVYAVVGYGLAIGGHHAP